MQKIVAIESRNDLEDFENRTLRVCAYCRVSTGHADQQSSFQSQNRYYSDLINKNPAWIFAGIYADEGISGTTLWKRDDFERMIQDCEEGKIDLVVTKSVTRFARNLLDSIGVVRKLKAMGIGVYFEKERLNTLSTSSEVMLSIYSGVAQMESENMSQNIHWSVVRKFQNGTYITSCPAYGFELDEDKEMVIVPEEAAVIRRIAERYLNGFSGADIAEELNRDQIESPGGGLWTYDGVMGVLSNEKLEGDCLYQKYYSTGTVPFKIKKNHGECKQYYVRDDHPAILTREEAEKLRWIIKFRSECRMPQIFLEARKNAEQLGQYKRALQIQRKREKCYPFSGKIFCGECGGLWRRNAFKLKDETVVFWLCKTRQQDKKSCSQKRIRESDIQETFLSVLKKLRMQGEKYISDLISDLKNLLDMSETQTEIRKINRKKLELKEERLILIRMQRQKYLDPAFFTKENQKIDQQLEECMNQERRLARVDEYRGRIKELEQLMEYMQVPGEANTILSEFDVDVFQLLVDKIVVQQNGCLCFEFNCGLKITGSLEKRSSICSRVFQSGIDSSMGMSL